MTLKETIARAERAAARDNEMSPEWHAGAAFAFAECLAAITAWNTRAALSSPPSPIDDGDVRRRTIEECARVQPPLSETHPYQATGYGEGWCAAAKAMRSAIRNLSAKEESR